MTANQQPQDYALRGITDDGYVRFWVVRSTEVVREAKRRHQTSPAATIALGRTLTGALLLGQTLKAANESVTLRVEGDGPLVSLTAVSDTSGAVRGYATETQIEFPEIWPGKVDIGFAVGSQGNLHVIKDLGLKEPYRGSVPLETGEIGDELARYFLVSEQTPSAVGLSVLLTPDEEVEAAGGFLIQLMPGADEELAIRLEQNLANCFPISELIAAGFCPEDLANRLLAGMPWQALSQTPLSFACSCSREKLSSVLQSLDQAELESIIAEQGQAEAVCRFCCECYIFPTEEIQG
jgi:molecular chaperone Hsp33